MPEASYEVATSDESILAWLTRSLAAPDPAQPDRPSQERATRISTALLMLAVLWVAGALILPATTPTELADEPVGLTLILVSVPLTLFGAYVLSRSRFTWAAAGFGIGVAGMGTVVASHYDPALAAAASSFFLFAILLTVGSLFLPLPAALLIGLVNLASSLAVPQLFPQAGPTALQVPYVFLGLNAILFVVVAPVRERDTAAIAVQTERARTAGEAAKVHALQADALRGETRSKDQLLHAATHEVRTPMTIIMLQLSILRRSGNPLSPKQQMAADILERNLKRLADLMDHLLDKARIDAGRLALEVQDMDVGDALRDIDESFRSTADQWGVRLRVVPSTIKLRADPLRLGQILFNLVGNALKFTPAGGRVDVGAAVEHGRVAIMVADSGPGLTSEQMEGLGRPFHQIHSPGPDRWRGAGLGLTITKALVQEHGGTLRVDSDGPGRGSRFTVILPVEGPKPEAETAAAAA